MADNKDEKDDDLEILPNPPEIVCTVDISEGQVDPLVVVTYRNQPASDRDKTHNDRQSRKSKNDAPSQSSDEPPDKRRRLNSTGKSVDIRDRSTTTTAKHSIYRFWRALPGLNYGGKCLNPQCTAYGEPIQICRGFGVVEPIKDVQNGCIQCPGCSQSFVMWSITIYQADVNVEYRLKNETETKRDQAIACLDEMVSYGESSLYGDVPSGNGNHNGRNPVLESRQRFADTNLYELLKFDVGRFML